MISENVRQAFTALSLNKKRTFLTMIGIIIGLCAVVLIVSFGGTISGLFREFIMLYEGQNDFYVIINPAYENQYSEDDEISNYNYDYTKYSLNNDELYEIMEGSADIYDIFRERTGYQAFSYSGRREFYSKNTMMGVTPGKEITEKLQMVCGRFISTEDNKYMKKTAVISDKTAEEVFGSVDKAIGNTIFLRQDETENDDIIDFYEYLGENNYYSSMDFARMAESVSILESDEFTVVGVYDFSTQNKDRYENNNPRDYFSEIYVPYSYLSNLNSMYTDNYFSHLQIIVQDNKSKPAAEAYIAEYLEKRKSEVVNFKYTIVDYSEEVGEEAQNVVLIFTAVFVLISSVSLVVGGIGLMNTMLVSVTERTKEIGIKKALGAKNREIRIQFLMESAVICLAASVFGIILAFFIGLLIETKIDIIIAKVEKLSEGVAYFLKNQHIQFTPSFSAIVVSTLFSLAVGLFFGMYPANKGAKMQPVDALRYE